MTRLESVLVVLLLMQLLPFSCLAQSAGSASVLQFHKNPSKDGYYIDPLLATLQASRTVPVDGFSAPNLTGQSYAQLLYLDKGNLQLDILVSATQDNVVSALFAGNGTMLWQSKLADAVPSSTLPCGNISPLVGVLATPVVDEASNTVFLSAKTTTDGGKTQKYQMFGLDVDTGRPVGGYPVDVAMVLAARGVTFETPAQLQRGGLLLQDGVAYAGYGGNSGDCQEYRGRVVGVRVAEPTTVYSYNTSANKGAIWAPGGPAGDGTSVFVGTGNTEGTTVFAEGNAVLRLQPDLSYGNNASSFWAPKDWLRLDDADLDLGTAGPITFDLPASSPSQLLFIGGKEGIVYLLDRNNLGGFAAPVASAMVSTSVIITAPALYNSSGETYVAIRGAGANCPGGTSGDLIGLRISQGSPPTLETAWCANATSKGNSPIATTSQTGGKATVWIIGGSADTKSYALNAYDGESGTLLYQSPATGEPVSRFHSPIQAKGRIYFSTDTSILAYSIGAGNTSFAASTGDTGGNRNGATSRTASSGTQQTSTISSSQGSFSLTHNKHHLLGFAVAVVATITAFCEASA